MVIQVDGYFLQQRQQFADLAAKYRFPSIFPSSDYVTSGGLVSYGPNLSEDYRNAASYVDKILKGAKPGDLPVVQYLQQHAQRLNSEIAAATEISLAEPFMKVRASYWMR
jgi:ABC-type uncharacterized transport system substrate-binding protein